MARQRPGSAKGIVFLLLEDEGVTRLTLVRHAQQDYPEGEEFDHTAWADPPLSGLGRTQAMALSAVPCHRRA